MRPLHHLLLLLVLAAMLAPAYAQEGHDRTAGMDQALAACWALPTLQREACVDDLFAPTPEQQARNEVVRVATLAYQLEVATALADSGEPRKLALAALLATWTDLDMKDGIDTTIADVQASTDAEARAKAWRAAAADRGGDDVITNLLLLHGDEEASRDAAGARWSAAEPDNLAPRLHDGTPVESVLAAAGQRRHYDLHLYDTVRWLMPTLAEAATPSAELLADGDGQMELEEFHALMAIALWSSVAIPEQLPLQEACRGDPGVASTMRRSACRRFGQVLVETSDTNVGKLFGIALLDDMAGTPEERAEARALRRRFDWRMQQWLDVSQALPNHGMTDFIRLIRDPSIQSEEQLLQRQLRDAGVALDPPPDWQPPRWQ